MKPKLSSKDPCVSGFVKKLKINNTKMPQQKMANVK